MLASGDARSAVQIRGGGLFAHYLPSCPLGFPVRAAPLIHGLLKLGNQLHLNIDLNIDLSAPFLELGKVLFCEPKMRFMRRQLNHVNLPVG